MSLEPTDNFEASRAVNLAADHLPSWQSQVTDQPSTAIPAGDAESMPEADRSVPSKFPVREDLNQKLSLWRGDLCKLSVGAIVVPSNDDMSDMSGLSGHVHKAAGGELASECSTLDALRTGEAVMCAGYRLPARRVIFTVAPRYKPQYRTAAENALHHCYRNAFQLIKEHNIVSIAYPPIQSSKSYPKEDAAHIAVRTVRRLLERYGEGVQHVVLCMNNDQDLDLYRRILTLYFPRNQEEEDIARIKLPADTGNELGETVVEERKVRISAMPFASLVDRSQDTSFHLNNSIYTGKTDRGFSMMKPDHDQSRTKQRAEQKPHEMAELEAAAVRYQRMLKTARSEDLSDIHQMQIVYSAGKDMFNRPVVAIVGKNCNCEKVSMDRVLLYFVNFLDSIVAKDYVVIYFHSNTSGANHPDLGWLKATYNLLPRKYKKNLKQLYAVHPTIWFTALTWFATPFVNSKFWKKMVKVDSLAELFRFLPPDRVTVPQQVVDFDTKENGTAGYVHQPDGDAHTQAIAQRHEQL